MTYTSIMSVDTDSASSSQYLSSSNSSLNASKKASSEISKTYKHASQLYLTRRLAEAFEALQPVIKASGSTGTTRNEDEPITVAPIALASTSQRIKIWSLYITLLNAMVDLGQEEGRRDFGSKEYGKIVRSVQNGNIWEQVVQDGYQGREASVDAEVVYNLSNLLLAQAPDQVVNQSRLETYLSSSANPSLDISAHLNNSLNGRKSIMNGASTPKDLSSRIKILELFTLHVLPRNNEWEYARSFITGSDVLDEERREAFLQTLEELQIAKEQETGYTSMEEDYGQEPEVLEPTPMEEPYVQKEAQSAVDVVNGIASQTSERNGLSHRRTSSEVDYGIEDRANTLPSSSTKKDGTFSQPAALHHDVPASATPTAPQQSQAAITSESKPPSSAVKAQPATNSSRRQQSSHPSQKPTRKPSKPISNKPSSSSSSSSTNSVIKNARHILLRLRTFTSNISSSLLTRNPSTAMFRTLMFLFAFLLLMSRRELRERIRMMLERTWVKVKKTIGMGVKVSYV